MAPPRPRTRRAYLGEWPDIALADYRKRLQDEGCLSALAEAESLAVVDFQPIHAAALTVTLNNQWDTLKQGEEAARLLFLVAGQLGQASAVSAAALGLLAGVSRVGMRRTPFSAQAGTQTLARRPAR